MPGTEEVQDELMDDIFSAAFDEALGEPEREKQTDEDAEKKAAEEAAAKAAEEEAAKKAAEEAAAKAPEPDPEVLALKAQIDETNKKIKEREEADAAAAKAAEEAAKKAEPSPEETEAWEKFKKDWPDQAAVIEKERLKTATEIAELKKMLGDLTETLKAQIAPVVASVAESEQDKFMQPILAVHPDVETLWESGKIKEWIEKQPRHLQIGYTYAFTDARATPQDVIAVVTAMKEATGMIKKDEPSAEEAAKKAAEEAAAKAAEEKRLKKMEIPTGVRTSVTAEDDPDDFDTAFEQEMKKFSK